MKFLCQQHSGTIVVFEATLLCPLCAAERKIIEDEKAFDDIERELRAVERALESEFGDAWTDALLASAREKANEKQPA